MKKRVCYLLGFMLAVTMFISIALPSAAKESALYDDIHEELYATIIKNDNSIPFDLRNSSGMLNEVAWNLQGGCSDGKYAYFSIWNYKLDKCRIIKVLLQDKKAPVFVGVSKELLNIDHGNDFAYNPNTQELIIVHCMKNYIGNKRITIIDANTLDVCGQKDITIPDKVQGADGQYIGDTIQDKLESDTIGFDGIAYNKSKDQYVVLVKETSDFIIFDSSFHVLRYLKTTVRNDYTNQGIDCTDDCIVMSQSRNKPGVGNILSVYNWDDGSYRQMIKLKGIRDDYEIENIFTVNDNYYAGVFAYDKDYKQVKFGYLYTIGTTPNVYDITCNVHTLKLKIGKNYQLHVNVIPDTSENKSVKWSSSNPDVASVDSNGMIKALLPGKTVITARTIEGLYKTSCAVTVSPPLLKAPGKLKTKQKSRGVLIVKWKKVALADGYQLQLSHNKKFSKLKRKNLIIKKKTSAKLKKINKGKWYIRIRAYKKYGGKKYYSSWSKIKKIHIK